MGLQLLGLFHVLRHLGDGPTSDLLHLVDLFEGLIQVSALDAGLIVLKDLLDGASHVLFEAVALQVRLSHHVVDIAFVFSGCFVSDIAK